MENNKPERYERIDGVLHGIFLIEEPRPVKDEDMAREMYNNIFESKNQTILDINTLEDQIKLYKEKIESYDKELNDFGNVFNEEELTEEE